MIQLYRTIWSLLTARERVRYLLVFAIVVLAAMFETLGVAAVLPFLQVLSDPEMIETNALLAWLDAATGFDDTQSFMVFLGFVVLGVVILSQVVKALAAYAMTRFTMMRGYALGTRLLQGYLNQPYTWFLNRHSSEISKSVLDEVMKVAHNCLLPAMQVVAGAVTAAFLCLLLVLVEPGIALGIAVLLGGMYGGIYMALRGLLRRTGEKRVAANQVRFHSVQEATGGLKDLKIMGLESHFLRRFRDGAYEYARHQSNARILGELPRFLLEGLAFGGLILVLIYLLLRDGGNIQAILPTIGFIAMAGLRLMPALQQVYKNLSTVRFNLPALENIVRETEALDTDWRDRPVATTPAPRLATAVELRDVTFSYPQADMPALQGLSLRIPACSTVGLVGSTGAGKSSVADMILGLLHPEAGALLVDGVEITPGNRRSWQDQLGYVPQQIYLADATIAGNIAFGIPEDEIDMAAVERAARMASLHDFVSTELPQGYATEVGERGVRLSGGQRQRVGIARALYHDPEVLILDEATSALDNLTERAVMEAVDNVGGQKTIVLIAHRLSTVRKCDTIFLLEQGRLVAEGDFDALIEQNTRFRQMAAAE